MCRNIQYKVYTPFENKCQRLLTTFTSVCYYCYNKRIYRIKSDNEAHSVLMFNRLFLFYLPAVQQKIQCMY